MQTTKTTPSSHWNSSNLTVLKAAEAACSQIAPTWPLDQFIAVNPWWERICEPVEDCATRLAFLSGATLFMPRSYYREKWEDGTIGQTDLLAALKESGSGLTQDNLFTQLHSPPFAGQMQLMTHFMDARRDLAHNMSWEHEVTHQISQFCATLFDRGQASWATKSDRPLFVAWLEMVRHEHGIGLLMGIPKMIRLFRELPADPERLIVEAVESLGIPSTHFDDYLEALLLSVNGWASWCAYLRWQDALAGTADVRNHVRDLLAIRLAWEWVLYKVAEEKELAPEWHTNVDSWEALESGCQKALEADWIWQQALEIANRERLMCKLSLEAPPKEQKPKPSVQAFFCIDVRSEVFRRALEQVDTGIRTGGFAGFFGLPVSYQSLGFDVARPQLPGLLSPSMTVHDCCAEGEGACHSIAGKRQQRLLGGTLASYIRNATTTFFSYVEAAGLFYGYKLIKDGLLGGSAKTSAPGLRARESARLKPRLEAPVEGSGASERITLAARILKAMSLTGDFPELVLLTGHGSTSENNPHAAGLDCGACCGQSGEVNARALAALLNDPFIREGLAGKGIQIPDSSYFLPALHNTTTDEVALFDLDEIPSRFKDAVERLQSHLEEAGKRARAERARNLNLSPKDSGLLGKFRRRSRDWSEVRPEWGLSNNASFIVAPRRRTAHMDLGGRAFLHDYDWRKDEGFEVLELIMTAPMIVTHWINMQYYASTVDNRRYGSGNKVLHNVVGGTIGVFEGNGGDLRTGLSLQSLHDGSRWMHEPVRLNVFIDAPRDAIEEVIRKHETVRHLVTNKWIHLYQLGEHQRPARIL